jgi:hypothetical protein
MMLRGESLQELSHVVLDLAADGQGLRDVEIEGPQAGIPAVLELVIGGLTSRLATDSAATSSRVWAAG